MDPLNWKREHQVALVVSVIAGATLGVLLGYLVQAAGAGPSGVRSLEVWLTQPLVGYVEANIGGVVMSGGLALVAPERFGWGLFGGILGGAVVFIAQLLRR